MTCVARSIGRVSLAALLISTAAFAASYDAAVLASIQFPAGGAIAVGPDQEIIADFFFPILLSGNAGFAPFAGYGIFNSTSQLLSVELEGPSGFANPYGKSVAAGDIFTFPVHLTNPTPAELSLTLRIEYSYSLSAFAGVNEDASSRVAARLFGRDSASPVSELLFSFDRALITNNSESASDFIDVFVTLAPGGDLELELFAETAGSASAVPEPGSLLTAGCAMLALSLIRVRRKFCGKKGV